MKDQEYEYVYDEEEDKKYCYPGSNVLINRLDIRDLNDLHTAEREYSMARYAELLKKGVTGKFDLKHLRNIHKYLFQDIYSWAGKLRTVDISKGNLFCRSQFIEEQFEEIHQQLKDEAFLKDITEKDVFSDRIAYYLSEINTVHPFREGNGRSQRLFCEQLCKNNGRFTLDFSNADKEEMVEASKKSFIRDYSGMEKLIRKHMKEEK